MYHNCITRQSSPIFLCLLNTYSTGVGDASVNPKKQKELSPSSMNQQEHKSSQQQMHHPQPPVPINGGMEKLTLNGNGPGGLPSGNGIKSQVPLRQQEEYPISKQQPMTDGRGGIVVPRKNEQPSKIFSHTDGGIMDEAFGNHQQQPAMHNYNPFWKQSPNYDYANAELQPGNNFGPLPAPPQYPNGGVQYGNGQNYGNAGYQYRGYSNMQGSPQQSPPQGIPMVPQGQPQYPSVNNNNNYNLPSNSHQQQQIYYNSNPSQGISNNAGSPISNPVNAQPSNIQNGGTSQASNAMIPSNPQGAPQPTTSKPNTNQQGAQPNSNNNSNSSNGKNSLSKLESEFIKSLKVQSLQGGSSDIQSEELSPHSAGAGAVFIFILGLGMSIIMVIIVGCRLRRVGRRQRGKNRLDPDYLVDGMYL
ncbi:hypothetical protein Ocin01_06981 [Orchesella cincta]|uniref:Uncharacterized protein n=1 Tax=Orchesella cincta TaxID=48709 RepID=A0A1D2N331_ORCCI|nr:hypothetical protein Ocin01_06981 [Orchesella cincta]